MDSTSAGIKAVGLLSFIGTVAALDIAPIATIALTVFAAFTSGILAARYAVREARKEIDVAFAAHNAQLHSDHAEFIETVTDDRIKSGG
jgi:hypothetical protein